MREVNRRAFDTDAEANLVDRLREQGLLIVSLVAVQNDQVVGHIAFSPVTVAENKSRILTAGLAPVATAPDCQGQGIGSRLIKAGLDACAGLGWGVVFVLGEPEFYTRFGFLPAGDHGLRWDQPAPPEYFLVRGLPDADANGLAGAVSYHPAFASV